MQIVIDIPDETYDYIAKYQNVGGWVANTVTNAILGGIPLPEGHSDLIEREPIYNALLKQEECYREEFLKESNVVYESAMNGRMFGFCNAKFMVADAPMIIPADKDVEYQRQIEQLEHDTLYETTFNPEDGSM